MHYEVAVVTSIADNYLWSLFPESVNFCPSTRQYWIK